MNNKTFGVRFASVLLSFLLCLNLASCNAQQSGKPEASKKEGSIQVPGGSFRYQKNVFDKINIERDILYKEAVNDKGVKEKLLLDIYQPEGDNESLRPAILWMHGGGFTYGFKESGIERVLAEEMAKKGYVCISINYRMRENPENDWLGTLKDAAEDASSALKWVKDNSARYKIDSRYISVGGHSAGGIIVSSLCYSKDLKAMGKNKPFSVINLSGGNIWRKDVRDTKIPCLVIHGTEDHVVDFSSGESFSDLLRSNRVPCTFYPLEGANHDLYDYSDEVSDVITAFLYEKMTGKEADITTRTERVLSYQKEYRAKQIDFKLDGSFDEWGDSGIIPLDQLKEVGTKIPSADDFTGSAMVGWNSKDPGSIYFAVKITDDEIQDIHSADNQLWEDDSIEVYTDLTKTGEKNLLPLMPWIIGADGREVTGFCTDENTRTAVRKEGNTYYYELALDISKAKEGAPAACRDFTAGTGNSIGISVAYNDCENGRREHQMGWIEGPISFRKAFGKLLFDASEAN